MADKISGILSRAVQDYGYRIITLKSNQNKANKATKLFNLGKVNTSTVLPLKWYLLE